MFNIVLYQPEIPPNTGNIMRLSANTGCKLHLIEPLGFSLDEKHLRRAGLDYVLSFPPKLYASIQDYLDWYSNEEINLGKKTRIYLCSTKANRDYSLITYKPGDSFIFGPETRGLPAEILEAFPEEQKIKIPMRKKSRSLNLANAVAVIIYEAWRQQGFI